MCEPPSRVSARRAVPAIRPTDRGSVLLCALLCVLRVAAGAMAEERAAPDAVRARRERRRQILTCCCRLRDAGWRYLSSCCRGGIADDGDTVAQAAQSTTRSASSVVGVPCLLLKSMDVRAGLVNGTTLVLDGSWLFAPGVRRRYIHTLDLAFAITDAGNKNMVLGEPERPMCDGVPSPPFH